MDVKEAGPFPVKKEQFRMTVNGQEWEVAAVPTTHLSDLLRKEFQLTGTKVSCGIGRCGGLLYFNRRKTGQCVYDHGLSSGRPLHYNNRGRTKRGTGYLPNRFSGRRRLPMRLLYPIMIIALKALFRETPQPSDKDIEEGLAGNLCRCTGYGGIIRSACRIRRELNGGSLESGF